MTEPGSTTSKELAGLLALLDLERLEDNLFRGLSPKSGWTRVYGGQVLAQALVAAQRTVSAAPGEPPAEPRLVHSLHAYFLHAGDPKTPIIYEVERARDGGSFTTRRVKAIQHGRSIFVLSASFQRHEGGLDHQSRMPQVPAPEQLPTQEQLIARVAERLPDNVKNHVTRERPIDMRLVEHERYVTRAVTRDEDERPVQHVWLRARGTLPDEPELHQAVLAYASDYTLLDTALVAHGKLLFDADIQMASLDHAIWFHRPFRADDWMLYAQDSPSGGGARGFCRGCIYTRDGKLVASVAQEGLMRTRRS